MIDKLPINFEIIANPINWFIVVLMLLIAGFAAHILLPATFPNNPANL
jgi:hypothetical protein